MKMHALCLVVFSEKIITVKTIIFIARKQHLSATLKKRFRETPMSFSDFVLLRMGLLYS